MPLSREDKSFLAAMANRKQLLDGHYEIPMPCKESVIRLEGNISMAEQRLAKVTQLDLLRITE